MKTWLLLGWLCALAAVSLSTPLPAAAQAKASTATSTSAEEGRQAQGDVGGAAQPAAQPADDEEDDDDDDDDDEEDDVDLGIEDDDDDDDDDDEGGSDDDDDDDDDDDEDYFERFFDDILGDDDEEEEDDEEEAEPVDDEENAVETDPLVSGGVSQIQGLAGSNVADYAGDYTPAVGEDEPIAAESSQNTVVLTTGEQAQDDGADDEEDDDDDDDDDDDEDDDDDDLDDIEAKRSRAMTDADMAPPAYIAKYNRYVDSIMERINRVLRKSYDPVNVRLQTGDPGAKKNKKTKNKTKKNKTKKTKTTAAEKRSVTNTTEYSLEDSIETTKLLSDMEVTSQHTPMNVTQGGQEARKRKKPTKASSSTSNKNKTKAKPKPAPLRARATLYGLASMKRDGDVTVNVMSKHTTVKTKFLIGPLVLKVEKEFGRGAKKELRSATATTAEMQGKLNLRVVHGGAGTLHSIKVLQPRQVRVESPDDHERTKEFVWKRSSHIAKLVSQKLLTAARSMLRPPPLQHVHHQRRTHG